MTAAQLRQQLTDYFSDGELRDLCFDLGIDYESLPGTHKGERARELILHMERRRDTERLLQACRRLRPALEWPPLDPAPGGAMPAGDEGWRGLVAGRGGDVIVGQVGANARNVAIGKGITQQGGDPAAPADERQAIQEQFAALSATLRALRPSLDPAIAMMADFQLPLLHAELARAEGDPPPSSSTVVQVGSWLLAHVPALRADLARLVALPATRRLLERAGAEAVRWATATFGPDSA